MKLFRTDKAIILAGTLIFAFAVILLYTGAWWVSRDSMYLVKYGISTNGRVVDFMPAPLIEFQTKDGKTIRCKSHLNSSPPEYYQGETVPVLYDPKEPGRAGIDSFSDLWMMSSIMAGLGTVFLMACIFAIYLVIRHRRYD